MTTYKTTNFFFIVKDQYSDPMKNLRHLSEILNQFLVLKKIIVLCTSYDVFTLCLTQKESLVSFNLRVRQKESRLLYT